jgi:hypothetical protein
LARERASLLRAQINEAKSIPLKKPKKTSKLQLELQELQKQKQYNDIEESTQLQQLQKNNIIEEKIEEEEKVLDLHKTIKQKPKLDLSKTIRNNVEPPIIVNNEKPKQNNDYSANVDIPPPIKKKQFEKIDGFYYM